MMHKKEQAVQAILEQRMLPLYYHDSAETSIGILHALYAAGVRVIEYTNRGEYALENFKALRAAVDQHMPGMLLGIGTIKTRKQARKFIAAKADFIICPSMNEEVADITHEYELLWIPGCMTPTEIAKAEDAGANLVKIFPGNILGPSFINAVKDLFPELKFIPTGGVDAEAENLKSWFESGVVAVGMGSRLITKELVSKSDFHGIRNATEMALQMVREAAGKK